jgi:hypothetical protein
MKTLRAIHVSTLSRVVHAGNTKYACRIAKRKFSTAEGVSDAERVIKGGMMSRCHCSRSGRDA